jgi:hypothetical protein
VHKRTLLGKRAINTSGFQIDLDVLYPTLAGPQVAGIKLACSKSQRYKSPIREDFLIQIGPAGDASTGHAQVNQVERLFAEGPRALIVSWNAEAQIRGNPGRAVSD